MGLSKCFQNTNWHDTFSASLWKKLFPPSRARAQIILSNKGYELWLKVHIREKTSPTGRVGRMMAWSIWQLCGILGESDVLSWSNNQGKGFCTRWMGTFLQFKTQAIFWKIEVEMVGSHYVVKVLSHGTI